MAQQKKAWTAFEKGELLGLWLVYDEMIEFLFLNTTGYDCLVYSEIIVEDCKVSIMQPDGTSIFCIDETGVGFGIY